MREKKHSELENSLIRDSTETTPSGRKIRRRYEIHLYSSIQHNQVTKILRASEISDKCDVYLLLKTEGLEQMRT